MRGFDMSRQKRSHRDNREFWQLVLDSQRNSGLSITKFCEKEGITPSTFYNWRKKLASQEAVIPEDSNNKTVNTGFLTIGRLGCESRDINISFPSGIEINVSNNCDINLLNKTINALCDRQC